LKGCCCWDLVVFDSSVYRFPDKISVKCGTVLTSEPPLWLHGKRSDGKAHLWIHGKRSDGKVQRKLYTTETICCGNLCVCRLPVLAAEERRLQTQSLNGYNVDSFSSLAIDYTLGQHDVLVLFV
jgi:hypothetical protein